MKSWILLIFIVYATCQLSSDTYEKVNSKRNATLRNDLAKCAKHGKNFFTGGNTIGLIGDAGSLFNQVLKELISVTPIVLIDLKTTSDFSSNVHYVIIATNVRTLYDIFHKDSMYGASQYIVLSTAKPNVLSDFSAYLRARDFFKVTYLSADDNGKLAFRQFDESLYNPIKGKTNILKTIIDCNDDFTKATYALRTTISTKASRPIKYAVPTVRTVDKRILKKYEMLHQDCRETSDKFINLYSAKISPVVMEKSSDVHNRKNWTVRDYTELVVRGEVDVTDRPLIEEMPREELNIVNYVSGDSLCFGIKLNSLDNAWNKLLLFVEFPSSYIVLITIALYTVFSYVTKKLYERKLMREYIKFMELVSSAMLQPTRLPKRIGLRVVIGMWLLLWFTWSNRNTSTITSSLAKNTFTNLPMTVEELDKFGIEFGGKINYRMFLNGTNDPVMDRLFKRYTVVSLGNSTEDELLSRMFLVERCSYYEAHNVAYRFNESQQIFTLGNNLLSFSITFVFKKGSPYYEQFNRVVLICQDTGLMKKWENECSLSRTSKKTGENTSAIILKLKDLYVAFVLLIVGYFVSALAFLIELCIKRK